MPDSTFKRGLDTDLESNLIYTKFAQPVLRPNRVIRERLINSPDSDDKKSVTVVIAPAGYGKTTLLAEWANRTEDSVSWLTLSDAENDLLRFWQYFTVALRKSIPTITGSSVRRISLMRKPPFETPLHPLLSEIASHGSPVSLFIDDFQNILDPVVLSSIGAFLAQLPSNLRVFIGSRTNPVSILNRIRKTTDVGEIRTRALSFTKKESADFFENALTTKLPADVRETLLKKTDGWIVGLQIAVLALRDADNSEAFARAFSGQHRHLLDFFKEEVLSGLLPNMKEFVVKTSILDRFNPDLCNAVLGRSDSDAVLNDLSSSDMFIMPLDESSGWFRFQSLFRDVALQFLEANCAQEVPLLNERASRWYAENRLFEEAAAHAVKAGDWERVVKLIDPIANDLLTSNKAGLLQPWIYRLPIESLHAAPYLSVRLARALMVGNLRCELEPFLEGPYRLAEERGDNVLWAAVESLRAHQLAYRGASSKAIEICHECLCRLPEDEVFYRGITHRVCGMAEILEDQPLQAEVSLSQARVLSLASGNVFTACTAQALSALVLGRRGFVNEGLSLIESTYAMSAKHFDIPVAEIPQVHSRLLYDAWQVRQAIDILDQFSELCDQTGYRVFAAHCQFMLARLKWADGDLDAVERHFESARMLTLSFGSAFGLVTPDAMIARMRFAEGNWNSVDIWERSERAKGACRATYDRLSLIERIRLWRSINSGDTKSAEHHLGMIRQLGQIARKDGRGADVVDSWIAQAVAQFHLNQVDMALCSLSAAISLAEPGGLIRPFMEEGPRILPLVTEATSRGMHSTFLAKIVPVAASKPTILTDVTLSEREVEILRLLSLGYQNHEIADRIVLSENTIKTHLRNVYSKLGIKNRTQAVARGRELHLVS